MNVATFEKEISQYQNRGGSTNIFTSKGIITVDFDKREVFTVIPKEEHSLNRMKLDVDTLSENDSILALLNNGAIPDAVGAKPRFNHVKNTPTEILWKGNELVIKYKIFGSDSDGDGTATITSKAIIFVINQHPNT